jgi:hypothetical protein
MPCDFDVRDLAVAMRIRRNRAGWFVLSLVAAGIAVAGCGVIPEKFLTPESLEGIPKAGGRDPETGELRGGVI